MPAIRQQALDQVQGGGQGAGQGGGAGGLGGQAAQGRQGRRELGRGAAAQAAIHAHGHVQGLLDGPAQEAGVGGRAIGQRGALRAVLAGPLRAGAQHGARLRQAPAQAARVKAAVAAAVAVHAVAQARQLLLRGGQLLGRGGGEQRRARRAAQLRHQQRAQLRLHALGRGLALAEEAELVRLCVRVGVLLRCGSGGAAGSRGSARAALCRRAPPRGSGGRARSCAAGRAAAATRAASGLRRSQLQLCFPFHGGKKTVVTARGVTI